MGSSSKSKHPSAIQSKRKSDCPSRRSYRNFAFAFNLLWLLRYPNRMLQLPPFPTAANRIQGCNNGGSMESRTCYFPAPSHRSFVLTGNRTPDDTIHTPVGFPSATCQVTQQKLFRTINRCMILCFGSTSRRPIFSKKRPLVQTLGGR